MTNSSSVKPFLEQYRFWLIALFALGFMELPIVSIPFKWFESYFHELSHGLAALISGGEIVKIQLFVNGAGLCTTRGGSTLLISFMGYCGATLWGVLLYRLASFSQKWSTIASSLLLLLLIISIIFWVRDLLTAVLLLVLIGLVVIKLKLKSVVSLSLLLQFIGVCIVLNSVKSPWYLFDGQFVGDGAALAQATMVPELVWIVIWFIIGLFSMKYLATINHVVNAQVEK